MQRSRWFGDQRSDGLGVAAPCADANANANPDAAITDANTNPHTHAGPDADGRSDR